MRSEQVKRFLRIPASGLVEYAIQMATLTQKEKTAIDLYIRQGDTQEQAAELAGVSVDAMQKWQTQAVKQLGQAWDGCWWIIRLIGEN